MSLAERFKANIEGHDLFSSKDKLLLAVSGGVDSVVLCELCKQSGYDFIIAHCNFKLRGEESDKDEIFVKDLAKKYAVPFYVKTFDTKTVSTVHKTSIEETARDLRYEWFYELLDKERSSIPMSELPVCILTGHHADDNIETVVMNFFRGTGIKGVRGILPVNNKIIRPLLFARRKEIEDFAWLHQLEHITDSSNLETAFTRNFFRNRILPEVYRFFPGTDNNLLNNANRFLDVEALYNQAVDAHKAKLFRKKGNEIHIPVLQLKKAIPLRTIVYEIIKEFGFTAHQSDDVIALIDSETGKYISSSTHRIIKHRHWFIINPVIATKSANIIIEPGDKEINFTGGTLRIRTAQPTAQRLKPTAQSQTALLDQKQITYPLLLRKWKAGDYFYPFGMKKKKKLARFFIDHKLSKTEKENAWVIESDKRIIWVVGHRIDERFRITERTNAVLEIVLDPAK